MEIDDDIKNECYDPEGDLVNIKFHEDKSIDDDDEDMKTVNLSGLLKLCLLNYIIKRKNRFFIVAEHFKKARNLSFGLFICNHSSAGGSKAIIISGVVIRIFCIHKYFLG